MLTILDKIVFAKSDRFCEGCFAEEGRHRFDLDRFEVGFLLAALRVFRPSLDDDAGARVADLRERLEAAQAKNIADAKRRNTR